MSTQQHGARRAAQHIRGAGIDGVRDPISYRIREKRRCQGDSSIFAPRDQGVVDVLHMVGIAVSAKLEVTIWEKDQMSAFMWPSDPDGKRWTSQRLRTVLQRESRIGMVVSLGIQSYREIAMGISRKYMREALSFHADTENEETADDGFNDIVDVQAGHGSHVAGMIYARCGQQASAVSSKQSGMASVLRICISHDNARVVQTGNQTPVDMVKKGSRAC